MRRRQAYFSFPWQQRIVQACVLGLATVGFGAASLSSYKRSQSTEHKILKNIRIATIEPELIMKSPNALSIHTYDNRDFIVMNPDPDLKQELFKSDHSEHFYTVQYDIKTSRFTKSKPMNVQFTLDKTLPPPDVPLSPSP